MATTGRGGGRTLITGWFSFPDGEATAGDVLALNRVRAVFEDRDLPYDVAWSPGFAPGELALEQAVPEAYERLVFVCGPLHGPQVAALHRTFAHCRRVAVGTSVIDPHDPAVTGFHRLLPRDGTTAPPRQDLSLRAPRGPAVPVVGVILTEGQHEYGGRRLHAEAARTVISWLAAGSCAPVPLETRLDRTDGRLCGTPEQLLSVLERLDAVVTDRLHGLVLALRCRVPPLAIDPVRGGAKVTAQARACGWPALIPAERLDAPALDHWLDWCLTRGRAALRRAPEPDSGDQAPLLPAALAGGPGA
ncbi:polysaccharide pyruvyl transferase family protein [Streptomyces carpaticus]|uniref:Polysaccharide pyruvyl transferase family protein n=1 Tax=Streptomyces carpaticus TaxID=285558 RepID=A0ABV4ZJM9_9ACTN